MKGHLERAKYEIAFGKFSPLRNFNLGRPPMRIRLQKKKKIFLYFSTTFSQPSKVVCFLTLPPFERAFEPLLPFKSAFEPSLLFERAFEPSLPSERAFDPTTI